MNQAEQREEALFEAALRLPADQRAAYLEKTCEGEADLRRRVEVLLTAFERAGGFMKQPVTPERTVSFTLPPTEKPGDRIGRYKIREKIGEGGCGVVYVAEQEEPVRRRVALKIIKLGMDTKQVIARFDAERQALAMMEHPNIAKIHDAGATDTGRPFFVMELVRGIKITDFCEQHQLAPRERLDLFIKVCRAIQHAHQKGIIHRDIKPSNILVTSDDGVPVPKVIDFGIAKATQGRLTDQTIYTAFEQFIGTPAYMSPEQAQLTMQDIDTRSDIYSLGVLLYELLTGTTPFDAKELLSKGLDEMRRTIREVEPIKPSTRLTKELVAADERRRTDRSEKESASSRRLLQEVRGDLDWIVMKCLEKDRTRRYETANGLATDISRHLDNEPVVARPPSSLYRFQKTVQRNKLVFAAGSVVVTALVIGLSVSMWMFVRERKARALAVAAKQEQAELRQQAEEARSNEAGLRVQAENAQAVEATFRAQAETARTNEVKLREKAQIAEKIAQVEADQLGEALRRLGKFDEAERFIRYALAVQRNHGSNDTPEIAATLNNLANVLLAQGKDLSEAESLCREAVGLRKKLLGDEHPDVANSLDRLAMALKLQGKYAEAEAADLEALAISKKLYGNEHMDVARSLLSLAGVLQADARIEDATARYDETLAVARKLLGDEHPYVHSVLNITAQMLLDNGRAADAEPLARECLAIRLKKIPDEWLTFTTQNMLGGILLAQQKYGEAEPLLVASYEAMHQRLAATSDTNQTALRMPIQRLVQLYEATGQGDKAAMWRNSLSGQ